MLGGSGPLDCNDHGLRGLDAFGKDPRFVVMGYGKVCNSLYLGWIIPVDVNS